MEWPTKQNPAVAKIVRTEYGHTFGIRWQNFEAMENRGGWSGPMRSVTEAEEVARTWAEYFDLEDGALVIEQPVI